MMRPDYHLPYAVREELVAMLAASADDGGKCGEHFPCREQAIDRFSTAEANADIPLKMECPNDVESLSIGAQGPGEVCQDTPFKRREGMTEKHVSHRTRGALRTTRAPLGFPGRREGARATRHAGRVH